MARRVIKSTRVKPKFTTKDFLDGVSAFERRMAQEFLDHVKSEFAKNNYDFSAIEEVYGNGSETIDKGDLSRSIVRKDRMVFIKDGQAIGDITYSEVFKMLDGGRKDLGILPQPIFKKAFDDFRPRYKQAIKNFLTGKK